MAQPCRVCSHPKRAEIDRRLVAGEPFAALAREFGLTRCSVGRHFRNHVSPALARVAARQVAASGESLLQRVESLIGRVEQMLSAAEQDGRVSTALQAVKELRSLLELLGKASGELDDRPQVTINLLASPEWLQMRSQLLGALAPYPEARIAAADVLELPAADVEEEA